MDVVVFWQVVNVEKVASEVKNYQRSISLASQTAFRHGIGKTVLSSMLTGREAINAELQRLIGRRESRWRILIMSVEIRNVIVPGALQDAMSMQAKNGPERRAWDILWDSEREVAEKFALAQIVTTAIPQHFTCER